MQIARQPLQNYGKTQQHRPLQLRESSKYVMLDPIKMTQK